MQKDPNPKQLHSKQAVFDLLQKYKLIAGLVHKQDMPHHDLVETLVYKENMAQLRQVLQHLPAEEIALILEELPPEDQLLIWDQLDDELKQSILRDASFSVLQILGKQEYRLKNPESRLLICWRAICTKFRLIRPAT